MKKTIDGVKHDTKRDQSLMVVVRTTTKGKEGIENMHKAAKTDRHDGFYLHKYGAAYAKHRGGLVVPLTYNEATQWLTMTSSPTELAEWMLGGLHYETVVNK